MSGPGRSTSRGRVVQLGDRQVLLRDAPEGWTPEPGTPDECPTEAECRFVDCDHNLLLTNASDRMGRRHPGGTRQIDLVTFRPVSCVLDVVDAYPAGASCEVIAEILGLSEKRRVEQVIALALERALANPDVAVLVDHVGGRPRTVNVSEYDEDPPNLASVISTPRDLVIRLIVSSGGREFEIALGIDASRTLLRAMWSHSWALKEHAREIQAALVLP